MPAESEPIERPTNHGGPGTGMLPENVQLLIRLERVESAIGKQGDEGMRGDIKDLKAEFQQMRSDVMSAIAVLGGGKEGTLDKLLRADPKTLTILVVAVVAIVAIVWGATVSYGDYAVSATKPPSVEAAP